MAPTRNSDDSMILLINSISEQIKRISEQQESLRTYLLTQIDELRRTVIAKDEHRESLDIIRREVTAVANRIDKLETTVTEKIEKVGREAKAQQDENFRAIIRVQAVVLGFIATTIVSLVIKLYFFH